MNRRTFLSASTCTAIGIASSAASAAKAQVPNTSLQTPNSVRKGDMLYRTLGRTNEQVSLIGLGGFHIGKQKDEQESFRLIRTAIERGITLMDNCWDYNNGQSEIRMGKVLKNGLRDRVYLMSKIDGRNKESCARQIEESLLRLQTDRIDLMQFHEIIRLEDPDRIFAPDSAWQAMLDAQKAGKIRHIGFTGHKDPIVHARMLDIAKQNGVTFDAVQMPINVMDHHFRSFEREILPRLVKENIGVLAMKTFGDPLIVEHVTKSNTSSAIELLHYSMTQPVSCVITGIDSIAVLDQACEAAKTFKPLTSQQTETLLAKMKIPAMTGQLEKFKTANRYDGTAKNPAWLG